MFNRIKKNAAQPQSVGIVSEEITKPRDPGFEDYSKVKGLSCTTDGASNCIPDSADPQPDLATNSFHFLIRNLN